MGTGEVIGLIALVVSCLSMLQGWWFAKGTNDRLEKISSTNNGDADQVDALIELNKKHIDQTNNWIDLLGRLNLGGNR